MTTTLEDLARVWRNIDDARDELWLKYSAEDKVLEDDQEAVTAALDGAMASMAKGNATLKTASGDVERKQQYKPSAADWGAVYRFIVQEDAFEMLHKRLGSKFIQKWAEEHDGVLPPGINVFTGFKTVVKKPGGTKRRPKGDYDG